MRIKYQELRNKRRTPLREGVPLDTPFLVHIDPTNLCNMRCSFCPTGHKSARDMRNNGMMDWNLYVKIIDGFKDMPHRIKQLTFCKDGEPMLHPRLLDMMEMAVEADIADKVWLKTNGTLLTPEINKRLVNIGLDLIGISIKAVSAEGYEKTTGVKVDYEKLKRMVDNLHSRSVLTPIYVNTVNAGYTEEEKEKFYNDFEYISDYVAIEDMHGWSCGFSDKITENDTVVSSKIACPWPLLTMSINFDGKVSACQEDWSMQAIVGDLNEETVSEAWRNKDRYYFIFKHLMGQRSTLPPCANCSFIDFSPDNIDDCRGELLERL